MTAQDPVIVWLTLAFGLAAIAALTAWAMDMLEPAGRDAGSIACFEIPGLPSVRD